MYERMLNKQKTPTKNEIEEYIGGKSAYNIELIKKELEKIFELNMELKFPFGNNYGWGYKFSHKSKHLFYLFFEKGSITIMVQINKIKTEKAMEKYNQLSKEGKNYWKNRYPCGDNGGWIHYRIINNPGNGLPCQDNKKQLKDIGIFLSIKTNKEINLYSV